MADQDEQDEHEVGYDPGTAPVPVVPSVSADPAEGEGGEDAEGGDATHLDEGDPVDGGPEHDAEDPRTAASERSSRPPRTSSQPPPRAHTSSEPPPREGSRNEERRSRLEGLLRESMRRAIEKGLEAGVGTISRADSAIRGVVDDAKLPREVLGYVFSQVDETKNVVVGAVAKEVRDFLDSTDLAAELRRALTSLSFEIKTEIRFIPNEAGEMKPKVKARVGPKRVSRNPFARQDQEDDDESDEDRSSRRPAARRGRGDG